ncbi:hydrophobin family protein [Streptomyces sp. URMC 126]|uniref:hydrophobin family protein n=1 Tax=Streptomyces sp. URMC 126 TaxID=3423401 RepID=UPI003F1D362C
MSEERALPPLDRPAAARRTPVKTIARCLAGLSAATTLALPLVLLPAPAGAVTRAPAGSTTPMHCRSVGAARDADVASVLKSLGVVLRNPDTPVGLSCTPTRNGDPGVNFCGDKDPVHGIAVIGRYPTGHICS